MGSQLLSLLLSPTFVPIAVDTSVPIPVDTITVSHRYFHNHAKRLVLFEKARPSQFCLHNYCFSLVGVEQLGP